jgi:hypothetical protein
MVRTLKFVATQAAWMIRCESKIRGWFEWDPKTPLPPQRESRVLNSQGNSRKRRFSSLGPLLGSLGPLLGSLGSLLGLSWASWALLGLSWALLASLGPLLGSLGSILARSWASLGLPWGSLGPPRGGLEGASKRDPKKKRLSRFFAKFGIPF